MTPCLACETMCFDTSRQPYATEVQARSVVTRR